MGDSKRGLTAVEVHALIDERIAVGQLATQQQVSDTLLQVMRAAGESVTLAVLEALTAAKMLRPGAVDGEAAIVALELVLTTLRGGTDGLVEELYPEHEAAVTGALAGFTHWLKRDHLR
jgi:hypothetical protein